MSYEGYTQYLCGNGHLYAFNDMANYGKAQKCNVCEDYDVAWANSVDQTNDDPPEFSAWRIKEARVEDRCTECDSIKKVISEVTYHVPTKEEMTQYYKEVDEYYAVLCGDI